MKVRFICGYYSDLAHKQKKRPEDYWDALNFCWAVKVGNFKHPFFIHDANGKTQIKASNFALARDAFGEWIEKSVPALHGGDDVILVPVPSKDGVIGATTFRSLGWRKMVARLGVAPKLGFMTCCVTPAAFSSPTRAPTPAPGAGGRTTNGAQRPDP